MFGFQSMKRFAVLCPMVHEVELEMLSDPQEFNFFSYL
jgi:hypothetical protein